MISFEESLNEIAGLTEFREGELPEWFRNALLFWGAAFITGPMEDDKLVDRLYRIDLIGHWGVATVDGEEVAVFECLGDEIGCVESMANHAHYVECSLVVVEKAESYQGGYTTFITRDFSVTPRPRAAKVLAGVVC